MRKALIAQLVERVAVNHKAVGSIPTGSGFACVAQWKRVGLLYG